MLSNRELFLLNTAQTSKTPRLTEVVSAEGVYLYGPSGERYIDLVSGFAVNNIGHRNARVVGAIKDQLDKHVHASGFGELVQRPQVRPAARPVSLRPAGRESVYITRAGTEATQAAIKLATRFTGRQEILAAKKAYHGSTQGALSLIGDDAFHQ